MDKQDTLRNLLLAAAVFVFILAIGPALFPPPRQSAPTTPGSEPAPAVAAEPAPTDSVTPPTVTPDGAKTQPDAGFVVVEDDIERTFEVGASYSDLTTQAEFEKDPYRSKLVLSNSGASLESAMLTDHAARTGDADRYRLLAPLSRPDGAMHRSFTVDKINLDGVDLDLHTKRWRTAGVTEYEEGDEKGQAVEFQLEIQKGGAPILRLARTWRLPQQPEALGRHDLHCDLSVTNLSDQPHRVVVTYHGGLGISQDRATDDRVIDYGVLEATGRILGTRMTHTQAAADAMKSIPFYTPSASQADQRLSWVATGNTYFSCTVAPLAANKKSPASYIAEASVFDADTDPTTTDDATFRFVTGAMTLPPAGAISYPAAVYLGEKDGRAFRVQPDYRDRDYYFQISKGFGWCTFSFLVELMISLLNGLFFVFRDFGVAIIILVLLVRAMLHPLTKRGQISMARMQRRMAELAPKIEEIKKKFANDKVRLNQEMMKLNINPAGQLMTCLPMFIQMPIWVALFLSLSNNILMRHEPLHFTWIHDLTAADALIPFSSVLIIPLIGWRVESFNLLPLLVSFFMYMQQKTAPKPPSNPNMTEEQRAQQDMMQKMMPMMSIMMLLIFYNMPSGLNLYIMFSSLFGWIEQVVIRKHIKQREAEGTLHKTPPQPGPGPGDDKREPRKPSWFERLQKTIDQAQKVQKTHRTAKPRR